MAQYQIDANEVFELSRGRYLELARHFLGGALAKALARPGRPVPNPWAPGTHDAMRLDRRFNENGKVWFNTNTWGVQGPLIPFKSLMIHAGVVRDMGEYFKEVGGYLGLGAKTQPLSEKQLAARQAEQRRRAMFYEMKELKAEALRSDKARERNEAIWSHTVPLFGKDGRPNEELADVWEYLRSRGLGALERAKPSALRDLRGSKALSYHGADKKYPALVARVQDERGYGVCLHRTYLENGHKAPVEFPKKLTGTDRVHSGQSRCIPIGDVTSPVMGVAEGIETALSCFVASDCRLPVWSCVCANELRNFIPPRGVTDVVIFADRDRSGTGYKAAKDLKERLLASGISGWIVLPRSAIPEGQKGVDWNDELINAPEHFPEYERLMRYISAR